MNGAGARALVVLSGGQGAMTWLYWVNRHGNRGGPL